ncbi:hypothetical protein HN51_030761, partial [Arachis hypogaea]
VEDRIDCIVGFWLNRFDHGESTETRLAGFGGFHSVSALAIRVSLKRKMRVLKRRHFRFEGGKNNQLDPERVILIDRVTEFHKNKSGLTGSTGFNAHPIQRVVRSDQVIGFPAGSSRV